MAWPGWKDAFGLSALWMLVLAAITTTNVNCQCLNKIPSSLPTPSQIISRTSTTSLVISVQLACNTSLIKGYTLYYQEDTNPLATNNPPSLNVPVSNETVEIIKLSPYINYKVTFVWVFTNGSDEESNTTLMRTNASDAVAPSDAPQGLSVVDKKPTLLQFRFGPPSRPNSRITSYTCRLKRDVEEKYIRALPQESDVGECIYTNLRSDSLYNLQVTAENENSRNDSASPPAVLSIRTPPLASQANHAGYILWVNNNQLKAGRDFHDTIHTTSIFPFNAFTGRLSGIDYFWEILSFPKTDMFYYAVTHGQQTAIYEQAVQVIDRDAHQPPGIIIDTDAGVLYIDSIQGFSTTRVNWLDLRIYFSHAENGSQPQISSVATLVRPPPAPVAAVTGLSEVPLDFALDPINGYIYWTTSDGLYCSDFHGNNRQHLIMSRVVTKISLDLDFSQLYFLNDSLLYVSGMDGSNPVDAFPDYNITADLKEFAQYNKIVVWFDVTGRAVEKNPGTGSLAGADGFANATDLRLFNAGRQPIPVPQRPVQNFQVLTLDTTASLSWLAPSQEGYGAGSYQNWAYRVDYAPVSSPLQSVDSAPGRRCSVAKKRSVTLSNLQPNMLYSFRVRPFNPRMFASSAFSLLRRPDLVNLSSACQEPNLSSKLGQQSGSIHVKTLPAASTQPILLLAGNDGIVSSLLNGQVSRPQVVANTLAVDYDRNHGSLVWVERSSSSVLSIMQSNFSASGGVSSSAGERVLNVVFTSGGSFSMAVDWIGRRVFWSPGKRIYQTSLVATNSSMAVPGAEHTVTDLTLDVASGYVYWVFQATIYVAHMNGDFRQGDKTIFTIIAPPRPILLPDTIIAIDYAEDKLIYFAVMGLSGFTLRRGQPRPTTGQLVTDETIALSSLGTIRSLSAYGSKVFWADGAKVYVVDSSLAVTSGFDIPAAHVAPLEFSNKTLQPNGLSVFSDTAQLLPSGCANLPEDAGAGTVSNLQAQVTSQAITITWTNTRPTPSCGSVYYVLEYQLTPFKTGVTSGLMYSSTTSTALTIPSLDPSTSLTLLKLRAYTPWFSSNSLSGVFITKTKVPTTAPSRLRTFYKCDAVMCSIELYWDAIPRANQNGPLSNYTIRVEELPSGDVSTSTVAGDVNKFLTDLEPGQYRFTVFASNTAGDSPSTDITQTFTAGGAVFTPNILTQTPTSEDIVVVNIDNSERTVLVDKADVGSDQLQFLEVAVSTNEVFFVTAIVGRLWDIRYKRPGATACTILHQGSTSMAVRAVQGFTFDYIGRMLYFSVQDNTEHTLHSVALPQGNICGAKLDLVTLQNGTSQYSSLSFARRSGLLYYLTAFRLNTLDRAGSSRKRRSVIHRNRQYINAFNSTAAVVDPFTGSVFVAVNIKPEMGKIWNCQSEDNCSSCVVANGHVDSLALDTTYIYWTLSTNSTAVFYWPRNGNQLTPVQSTSRRANAPIITYGTALQPEPSAECRLPPDSGSTQDAPTVLSITETSVTVQLPRLSLSPLCTETRTFAAVTITTETKDVSGQLVTRVQSLSRNVTISGLLPFSQYSIQVIHLSNFWGNQTVNGTLLSVVTSGGLSSPPVNISVSALAPDAVLVAWLPPSAPNGQIVSYGMSATAVGMSAVTATTGQENRSAIVKGLQPSTNYTIQVWAVNGRGPGMRAQLVAVTLTTPLPPRQLTAPSSMLRVVCDSSLPAGVTCKSMEFTCLRRLNCVSESSSCSSVGMATRMGSGDTVVFQLDDVEGNSVFKLRRSLTYNIAAEYTYSDTVKPEYKSAATAPTAARDFALSDVPGSTISFKWNPPLCLGGEESIRYTLRFFQSNGQTKDIDVNVTADQDGTIHATVPSDSKYVNVTILASNGVGYSPIATAISLGNDGANGVTDDGSSSNSTVIIIIAAVGGTLLLIILIAIIYVRHRSSTKSFEPTKPGSLGQVFNNYGTGYNADQDEDLIRIRGRLPTGVEVDNQFYLAGDRPDDILPIFPRERLTLTDFLGQGAFGEVYKGVARQLTPKEDETIVAVKTLHKNAEEKDRKDFLAEAKLMSQFDHPHILKVLGVCIETSPCFIILEIMEKGDLLKFIRKHRPETGDELLTFVNVYTIISDVAQGCAYLENLHFVHRDLAARNCLVGGIGSEIVVKIGDFGLARDIYKNDYYRKEGAGLLPVRWMAPESLLDGVFTTQSDVWSFGILLWEVSTLGNQPYPGRTNQEVLKFVCQDGGRLDPPPICPHNLAQMMLKCWAQRPMERPRFTDIADEIVILHEEVRRNQSLGLYGLESSASHHHGVATFETGAFSGKEAETVPEGFEDPHFSPELRRSTRRSLKRSSSRRRRPDGIPLLELNKPGGKVENEYVEGTPVSRSNSIALKGPRIQTQDSHSSYDLYSSNSFHSKEKPDLPSATIVVNLAAEKEKGIPDQVHQNWYVSGRESSGLVATNESTAPIVPEGYDNHNITGRQANGHVAGSLAATSAVPGGHEHYDDHHYLMGRKAQMAVAAAKDVVPEGYDNHHITGRRANTAAAGTRPVPAARNKTHVSGSAEGLPNQYSMHPSNLPVARDRAVTSPSAPSNPNTSYDNLHITNTPLKRGKTSPKTRPPKPLRSESTRLSPEASYQNMDYHSKGTVVSLSEREQAEMASEGSRLVQNSGSLMSISGASEDEGVLV